MSIPPLAVRCLGGNTVQTLVPFEPFFFAGRPSIQRQSCLFWLGEMAEDKHVDLIGLLSAFDVIHVSFSLYLSFSLASHLSAKKKERRVTSKSFGRASISLASSWVYWKITRIVVLANKNRASQETSGGWRVRVVWLSYERFTFDLWREPGQAVPDRPGRPAKTLFP